MELDAVIHVLVAPTGTGGDVAVDEEVIGCGVAANQVHRGPVFRAVGLSARETEDIR